MTSETFTCNICFEEEKGKPDKTCCGLKYCFACCHQTTGLCYVCEKDEISEEMQCDVCGKVETMLTIGMCAAPEECHCDMMVCNDCNKAGPTINGTRMPFAYCSWKHFEKMLVDLEKG